MIEIEYIVKDRHGVERLRTADKKAADAYDRMLDNAERLAEMLRADQVLPGLSAAELEDLTIYLVRNAREVELILKGKSPGREMTAESPSEPDAVSARAAAATAHPAATDTSAVVPLKAAG